MAGLTLKIEGDIGTISVEARVNIEQLIPVKYESIGSVEGKLEAINLHRRPKFIVYHSRTHKAVTCYFSPESIGNVKNALGHNVQVSGTVEYNSRNEPLKIHEATLRQMAPDNALPSISDILGLIPDLTGTTSTKEFVRSTRG